MSNESYNQFCPIAMACEIIEPRWTLLILCEMWNGSTRFNEIKRGVPGMSPTLLSTRLKGMEHNGLINRIENRNKSVIDYKLTDLAQQLAPIIYDLGKWAHRNLDAEVTLEHLDAKLLMWNVRRKIDDSFFPKRKVVIEFIFPEQPSSCRQFWLIAKPDLGVDLCSKDPAFDVDLYVTSDLKTLTSVWIGLSELRSALISDKIKLVGESTLKSSISQWLVRSSFAPKELR